MKIKYSNRQNEQITRHIEVGQKLVGIRLDSFIIESYQEFQEFLSEKGLEWARRNLNFRPHYSAKIKESNWGSDWVDDGV